MDEPEDERDHFHVYEAFGRTHKLWVPGFPRRFKDAIPLAVELSGFSVEFWSETIKGCLRWVSELAAGNDELIPENLRDQPSGLISDLVLAFLGSSPPEHLARELDRRIETMRSVDHPRDGIHRVADAKYYDDDPALALDEVERTRKTLETVRSIVAAFDPAKPKA